MCVFFYFSQHMFRGNGMTFNTASPAKHMRPYSKLGRQITGIRRVLLSRRRISETAGGSPRLPLFQTRRACQPRCLENLLSRLHKGGVSFPESLLFCFLPPVERAVCRAVSPSLSVREAVLGGVMPKACLQSSCGENVT